MKYKAIEFGMFLLTIIPFAMVSKNGNGKWNINYARIAEFLLGVAIVGLAVGYIDALVNNSVFSVKLEHITDTLIEIKESIKSFHGE